MDQNQIQETMEQYIKNGEMTGGILYVHRNGELLYQNKWGSADAGGEKPVEYEKTMFRMASLSKVVTAVGILKLVEEGKLGLDDELKDYLPEFAGPRVVVDKRFEGMDALKKYVLLKEPAPLDDVKTEPAQRELSIRDLLTYSAGLEMGVYGFLKRTHEAKPEDTLKDRAGQFARFALDFQPGTATGYSFTGGFDVLGRVIEVISGMELYEYMRREIFEPLEMYDTVYQMSEEQRKRLVPLYKPADGKQVDVSGSDEDLCGIGSVGHNLQSGSAGVYCTAQDIDHLTQMLANEGWFGRKQVLQPETVKKMYTETAYSHLEPEPGMEWALGVKVRKDPQKAGSFASEGAYGWSGAYGTHMVVSPGDGLALTFVMNRADIGGSGSYISRKVEELVFGIWGGSLAVSQDTTMAELYEAQVFSQAKGKLIGGGEAFFTGETGQATLGQLQEQHPTWYLRDMIYGLERLQQVAEQEEPYIFPVYSEEERKQEPELEDVCLFYLPAKKPKTDKYAILLAGGAYGAVCTMVESLPAAAKLNNLGMTCFCLNYRTIKKENFRSGLMPKPLDDLAAAWRLIKEKEQQFGICAEKYIVGGFSAGGHAAAMWGTARFGYRKYQIPGPELLLLAYPLIAVETLKEDEKRFMGPGMFGADYTDEILQEYAADRHVDSSYPKVYLIQSIDDDTVPYHNAQRMGEALKNAGVNHEIETISEGGHGFGLGTATPGNGWIERALKMLSF